VLAHLGTNPSLAHAIEQQSQDELALRQQAAKIFQETRRIADYILADFQEELAGKVPSLEEAERLVTKAKRSHEEYSHFAFTHPDRLVRWRALCRTEDLYDRVQDLRLMKDDAIWYDKQADAVQEKMEKLIGFKQKYQLP
jgi:hypothetical protein